MKKITVFALMLLGISTISFAQRGERQKMDPEKIAQQRADRMKEELKLSENQHQEVLELIQKQASKRAEQREEVREKLQAKRQEAKKEREAYEASLQSILTKEQYELHKTKMELRQQILKNRKPERRKAE